MQAKPTAAIFFLRKLFNIEQSMFVFIMPMEHE